MPRTTLLCCALLVGCGPRTTPTFELPIGKGHAFATCGNMAAVYDERQPLPPNEPFANHSAADRCGDNVVEQNASARFDATRSGDEVILSTTLIVNATTQSSSASASSHVFLDACFESEVKVTMKMKVRLDGELTSSAGTATQEVSLETTELKRAVNEPPLERTFTETGIGRHCLRFLSRSTAETVGPAATASNQGRIMFTASFD